LPVNQDGVDDASVVERRSVPNVNYYLPVVNIADFLKWKIIVIAVKRKRGEGKRKSVYVCVFARVRVCMSEIDISRAESSKIFSLNSPNQPPRKEN